MKEARVFPTAGSVAPALHQDPPVMLTIGGLLLGTVLTAPVASRSAAPADPIETTEARVTNAQGDAALGLRDPFAREPHHRPTAATRRPPPRPSSAHADLRNPFAPGLRRPTPSVAQPSGSGADLRSPFDRAHSRTRPSPRVAAPSDRSELRDPFGR